MGAAGVGAEVQKIYGEESLTIASIFLTLAVLILSEIIPKLLDLLITNLWQTFLVVFCHH